MRQTATESAQTEKAELIAQNLAMVRARMTNAAIQAGRDPASVALIAVSKTRTANEIEQAYQAGQRHFGENYLQEALAKMQALQHLPLVWHFIGPIQSNKTRAIAEHFDWVHGVESFRIAKRLSEQRPADRAALNICLQINIDGESTKSGLPPEAERLAELALQVAELPRLKLRGLMTIPAPQDEEVTNALQQREPFRRLAELLPALSQTAADTLSMGMSDDLAAAIAEGATMVRVGTAIFGERANK